MMLRDKNRTFYLVNSEGVVYTLTELKDIRATGWIYGVSGLGYELDTTFQKIDGNYQIMKEEVKQGSIAATIYFHGKYCYQEYTRFTLFCQEKPLTLIYRTAVGEFKRDGIISKIEKTENGGAMKVNVVFTPTNLWYREIQESVRGDQLTLESDSDISCPCCLKVLYNWQAVTAPTWNQRVNNSLICTGGLNSSVTLNTEYLYVRTDTNPYGIYRNSPGHDLYGKSDFSKKRFCYIEKGTNLFTFSNAYSIEITGKIYYETI